MAAPTVEEIVRRDFADAPIMIEIARCESRFRQFDEEGRVLRGEVNPHDVGVFQINERYHLGVADAKGHNIYKIQGNLAYARELYIRNGTQDWDASQGCWRSATRSPE